MTLVHTSQFRYSGPDRFDITRKSGGKTGKPFAPSWRILSPALYARKKASDIIAVAKRKARLTNDVDESNVLLAAAREEAEVIEREAWSEYYPKYFAEMRGSVEVFPLAWDDLLARQRVVLVCYCADVSRCHRGLLAGLLVEGHGAVRGRELEVSDGK